MFGSCAQLEEGLWTQLEDGTAMKRGQPDGDTGLDIMFSIHRGVVFHLSE
jgi:hypothetical protein